MALWYDKKGNDYIAKGNSSWIKAYAEHLTDKLSRGIDEEKNAHYTGKKGRHGAADIDYDKNNSVKEVVDDLDDKLTQNISNLGFDILRNTWNESEKFEYGGTINLYRDNCMDTYTGTVPNTVLDSNEEINRLQDSDGVFWYYLVESGRAWGILFDINYPLLNDENIVGREEMDGGIPKDKIADFEKLYPTRVQRIEFMSNQQSELKMVLVRWKSLNVWNSWQRPKCRVASRDFVNAKVNTQIDEHRNMTILDHLDKSVTTEKLADKAIIADKIGTSAIETDKIKDNAVTKAKVGNGAISSEKIENGAVSEEKLSPELTETLNGKEESSGKGQPNGYVPLDVNGKIPESYLYGTTVKQYGVRWDGTSSTACTRLGNAAGLTATIAEANDFDNIYPWSNMKLCNIDKDGNILAYIGEPTFKKDGTNGDVMVEIPKFYYKRVKTGTSEEIWICEVKLPGYELHPVFINDGKEVIKVFHSAYNASTYTDTEDNKIKLQSISGVQPSSRRTRAEFRTYARNKGSVWGIEDISCISALQMLYLVEYANTNSQSTIGGGANRLPGSANNKAVEPTTAGNTIVITSASNANNPFMVGQRIEIGSELRTNDITTEPRTITAVAADAETEKTTITFDGDPVDIAVDNVVWCVPPLNGSCDSLNGKSGYSGGEYNFGFHKSDVSYRGIEGFHAKMFRHIDGINIKDYVAYCSDSMSDYADKVYDGKYKKIGYTIAKSGGYVSELGYDQGMPWAMLPIGVSGSTSTYIPDSFYSNSGERSVRFGGGITDFDGVGAFFFACHGGYTDSSFNTGAHILVKRR